MTATTSPHGQLDVTAVLIAAVGLGWTEAPYSRCDGCCYVFGDADLTYEYGPDGYFCPGCMTRAAIAERKTG